MAIDPLIYEAPPPPTQGYGLYAAARLIDTGDTSRELLAGTDIHSVNCDLGSGTYGTDLCETPPAVKTPGTPGPVGHFDPIVVYAASACATGPWVRPPVDRARQTLTLREPGLVESAFGARMLVDAEVESADGLVEALGAVEAWLGERGIAGYVHASRRHAALAASLGLIATTGAALRTSLGNTWVFGGGYDSALGTTLVATGPVTVWRSSVFERDVRTGADGSTETYALAERVVTVGYECDALAVTIA